MKMNGIPAQTAIREVISLNSAVWDAIQIPRQIISIMESVVTNTTAMLVTVATRTEKANFFYF
jgi:chitodextrinase